MSHKTPTPAYRCRRALALYLGIALAVLVTDLATKYWSFRTVADLPLRLARGGEDGQPIIEARTEDGRWVALPPRRAGEPTTAIPPHEGRTAIPIVLDLRLTINTGAVFGLGQGAQRLFILISIIAAAVITFIFVRSDASRRGLHIALAMILGGALGNLYDRALYNGVRDMLHLFPDVRLPFGLSWPGGRQDLYPWIFNVADMALVLGVIAVVLWTWHYERLERKRQSARG